MVRATLNAPIYYGFPYYGWLGLLWPHLLCLYLPWQRYCEACQFLAAPFVPPLEMECEDAPDLEATRARARARARARTRARARARARARTRTEPEPEPEPEP
jgi:hypothetical protein